jgi:hypothetical protein
MEYLEYMGLQNKQFADSVDSMRFHLSMVDSLPEGQRAEYWRKNLSSGAPQGFGEYSPETLATLRRNLDQGRNSMMSQLIDDYEWYKGRDPAMAQRILDYMDRMGRGGLGSTKSEREVQALWGWTEKYGMSPTKVAVRFDELNDQLRKTEWAVFRKKIAPSPQEQLLFDSIPLEQFRATKSQEEWDAAVRSATETAYGMVFTGDTGQEDFEFYQWAKKGRNANTYPTETRPDIEPPPVAEPEAADRPVTPPADNDFSGMSEAEAAQLIQALPEGREFTGPDGKPYTKGPGGGSKTSKRSKEEPQLLSPWVHSAADKAVMLLQPQEGPKYRPGMTPEELYRK